MFLIRAGFFLGLLVTLALLNKSKALPITTTLPPSIPRRAFLDPLPELVFKDNSYPVEFQDIGKRPQQPHENIKFPRGWSSLSGDFYDPNFRVETNNVYYNFNDHDGFYPDDEYFTEEGEEEEINHLGPYSADSKSDQHNKGYTNSDFESDVDTDVESDLGTDESKEDRREGIEGFETLLGGLIGGLAQLSGGVKPTQKPTNKPVSPANPYFPPDFEAETIKNADIRAKPPPPVRGGYNQFAYQPNLPPPPPMYPPMQQSQELRRPQKDSRLAPQFIEEPAIVEPEKPIFSRTTTVSKTTSWYANNNNELVLVEDIDAAHIPLKVKYEKTSRTSSSGPTPPYLQAYEDVLFHEENEKGRTIIEKLSDLKGLNPTAITSYTNSPSLSTTEFHEEVLFEEDLGQVRNINNEFEIKLSPDPIVLPEQTYEEPPKEATQPDEPPEEPKQPEEPPKEPMRSHFFIDGNDAPINIDDIENSKDAVYEEPTRSHFFIDGGDKLIDIDTIEEEQENRPPPRPLSPSLSHPPSIPLQPHPQSKPLPEDLSGTLKNQPPPHLLSPPPPHPPSAPPPHPPPPPPPHPPSPPPPHPPSPPPHPPSPPLPPHKPLPPHPPSPPLPPPPSHSPSPPRLPSPPPHPSPQPSHPPPPPTPEASFPHQPSAGPKLEPNHNQVPGFSRPPPLGGQHPPSFGNLPKTNNWELMGQRRPEPSLPPHGPPDHPDSPMMKDDNRQRIEMRPPLFPNRPNPNRH